MLTFDYSYKKNTAIPNTISFPFLTNETSYLGGTSSDVTALTAAEQLTTAARPRNTNILHSHTPVAVGTSREGLGITMKEEKLMTYNVFSTRGEIMEALSFVF